ncbi:helix-turn-helix domain-containing protein [Sneathiella chinensis]|uniref:DNA-binding protein n=1 Tax=Sneathiella chinensis TaxID=349750 RepID=A0ABQ5U422_9PROT|nr:XRE family transcriptional regulator [Sneathiella chinensis]GLQ06915.1 DNA-binding protein [Sneathiella chinensis]
MQEQAAHLSKTLKARRKVLGWSLDRAAEQTGVSKAMLGQIERGESSPTVATLWKIATGLEMSLSSLIEAVPDNTEYRETLRRDADRMRRDAAGEGLAVAPLFPYEERFGFEYLELTLRPGYERISEPHEPGVVEFVTVLEGQPEILSEGVWHPLAQGQSLRFAGDREHGYRNRADEKAVFLCVIHYPAGRR